MKSPTLRERKKLGTRRAIAEAAARLFRDRGYDATPMDDVAREAEVGRRTVFRHFPTKADLIFPTQAQRLARFRELLAHSDAAARPFERVSEACRAMAADFAAARGELLLQHRLIEGEPVLEAKERELERTWEAAVAEALTAWAPRGTGAAGRRRARFVAALTVAALRATLEAWYATKGSGDLIEIGEEAFGLLEQGIAAPQRATKQGRKRR